MKVSIAKPALTKCGAGRIKGLNRSLSGSPSKPIEIPESLVGTVTDRIWIETEAAVPLIAELSVEELIPDDSPMPSRQTLWHP
jgi:hypothetical protein